ncbi:phage major capsid protein [Flagellimonas sp.]|uniref:phage major capsid family protein n=1 Tax=Flagellimonas sp. TaxID=2058762 RepID=UPI003BAAC552
MTEEEKKEQEKALLAKIKEQNKEQIAEFKEEFKQLMQDSKSGVISEEAFNTKFDELSKKLENFDPEAYKKFQETLEGYEEKLKAQGTEIKKLKDGGTLGKGNSLKEKLEEVVKSDDFKEFVESGGKKKASFSLKAVSVTDDYTGTSLVHITSRDSRVVDHPQVQRLNIRDLLTVMPADLPYLAFIEVYDWDRQVGVNTENGELAESSFKIREATVDAKRIGTHVPISKRMIKSAAFVVNHLAQRLPAQVRYYEDFQLLHGDGAGNNVSGIFKVASDFATLIDTALTGSAGAVASVASYDGGAKAIVTFAANQLINNGDKITFANATHTGYNAEFIAKVISPKQILIDKSYTAEADTSAWTFSVSSPFKDAIDAAQEIDVLKVAKTLVTVQEYTANGIVLNPVDATKIETLKGTDEHYIDVQRLENGVLTIGGVPVVETTAMPAGKFVVGDWAMAAALGQFSELTLEFSESTQEKLKNSVEAIIQEEVLFPIYNKYMFVTGDFTTGKAALETP